MKKHFIVERETGEPKLVMAFELFQIGSRLEMIQAGAELLYADNKYRVKRVETVFDINTMYGAMQDHINIYIEEI